MLTLFVRVTSMYAGEGMDNHHFTEVHDIYVKDLKCKKVNVVYLANLHTSFLCNLIYPTFSRILLYSC